MWALGITLYCFLSGTVPWNDMTHVGIYSKIMTQPIQLQATVSEDCLDLIKSMLEGINSKLIHLVEITPMNHRLC